MIPTARRSQQSSQYLQHTAIDIVYGDTLLTEADGTPSKQ
jgi:hypothetical protein